MQRGESLEEQNGAAAVTAMGAGQPDACAGLGRGTNT